jgi:hypothetical protein
MGDDPMSRWIVVVPVLAIGVSIGGSQATSAASLLEALSAALLPAQANPAQTNPAQATVQQQKPAVQRARHRQQRAQRSKMRSRDPVPAAVAKDRAYGLATSHSVNIGKDDVLVPHSVPAISVPPLETSPPAAPPLAIAPPVAPLLAVPSAVDQPPMDQPPMDRHPTALLPVAPPAPTLNSEWGPRPDVVDVPEDMVALSDDDDSAIASFWPALRPSSAPPGMTELMVLLGGCAVGAIGIGALAKLRARRRGKRNVLTQLSRLDDFQTSTSRRDAYADRVARQRLFPHQMVGPYSRRLRS